MHSLTASQALPCTEEVTRPSDHERQAWGQGPKYHYQQTCMSAWRSRGKTWRQRSKHDVTMPSRDTHPTLNSYALSALGWIPDPLFPLQQKQQQNGWTNNRQQNEDLLIKNIYYRRTMLHQEKDLKNEIQMRSNLVLSISYSCQYSARQSVTLKAKYTHVRESAASWQPRCLQQTQRSSSFTSDHKPPSISIVHCLSVSLLYRCILRFQNTFSWH